MGRQTWDRRCWTVTPAAGEPFNIETEGGATWALRALIAAGSDGTQPTDGASGRFAMLVGKLRDFGLQIEDRPVGGVVERPGFRLACSVEPSR